MILTTEADLIGVARALIDDHSALSPSEVKLLSHSRGRADPGAIAVVRGEILAGADPLGDAFCKIRSPAMRRAVGATYTPRAIVAAMVRWAAVEHVQPARVVDPGAGSGRFLIASAERFPLSWLVAVEVDPLATLLLRANAAVLGFSDRLEIRIEDFRKTTLSPIEGATLFVGNPPYLRHHGIGEKWKAWFARAAHERGLKASKLAGLHVHFFLKTLLLARPGDLGAFVTAAEWLDVNYGSVLRSMLADGLGGSGLHVIDPAAMPFEDATTTAAITCFRVGNRPEAMRVRSVSRPEELDDLSAGLPVSWARAVTTRRWSILVRGGPPPPKDRVELGELFHVHRGQVTGANAVWIHGDRSRDVPRHFLVRTITRAKELLAAGDILCEDLHLRLVIDLPADLDALNADDKLAVERFLAWARTHGADRSYIARHRRAWWSVGLKPPAPILCTYMARRPPAFVRNLCGARHLNIAHGLYPRQPISEESLRSIVSWLSRNVHVQAGRTYAGGLTKFEPGEIERIPVPDRWQLVEWENEGGMSNKQVTPPLWDEETLARQAQSALDDIVARRMQEPSDRYIEIVSESRKTFGNLVRLLGAIDVSNPEPETVRTIVGRPDLRRALRYVAGPPVSEDDLGVLVTRKVKRLSNKELKQNDALSAEVLKLICRLADARRFPWLQHRRRPRAHELKQAIRGTAVLLASQTMQTERRAYGRAVERALRDRLQAIGYARVAAPNRGRITAPIHMPTTLTFYGECSVHGRRTDLLIGLPDGRAIAVEAKDSSSVVNSVKRVLNDTAAKAEHWHAKFGEMLIPVALLSGVFGIDSLRAAQAKGLYLVFAHDLDSFVGWLEAQ